MHITAEDGDANAVLLGNFLEPVNQSFSLFLVLVGRVVVVKIVK